MIIITIITQQILLHLIQFNENNRAQAQILGKFIEKAVEDCDGKLTVDIKRILMLINLKISERLKLIKKQLSYSIHWELIHSKEA
jgi:hypothetical protein